MILLDACHSGGINLDRLLFELGTNEFRVAVMASSTADEFSYEDESFGGGAFTQALWLGMHDGEADATMSSVSDRRVDNDELGVYVRRKVPLLIETIAPRIKRDNPTYFARREVTQTPVNNFQALNPNALTLLPE